MRALVTGGAGFIGATVAAMLLESGHHVVVVDDLSYGDESSVPEGAVFHRCSVSDAGLGAVLGAERVDVCLHFAGRIAAGESMVVPAEYFRSNVAETMVLLDTLVAHGVERFVFSSSAAVYGEPQAVPIDESHPTSPVNPYGESKLLVERALGWLERRGSLRCAALRYFNAAGAHAGRPERHRPETHLIPLALDALERSGEFVLFGDDYPTRDGTCVRDYIHVADLAEAHVLALDALAEHASLVCNLGTGTGYTNAEVLATIAEVTGRQVPMRIGPRRDGDPAELVASSELARRVLGWAPSRSSLPAIVEDAWRARRDREPD